MRTALVLGATGLTGGAILQQLLQDENYSSVIIITRKNTGISHPKLKEIPMDPVTVVSSDRLPDHVDTLFSCLGTTRKKTPDLNLYRQIELAIPVKVVQESLKRGLEKVHFISAIGANPESGNFYLAIKGEAENALSKLPIPVLHIYRPSLIEGKRAEKRWVEVLFSKLMYIINFTLIGTLKKYRSVKASTISNTMIDQDLTKFSSQKSIHYF